MDVLVKDLSVKKIKKNVIDGKTQVVVQWKNDKKVIDVKTSGHSMDRCVAFLLRFRSTYCFLT